MDDTKPTTLIIFGATGDLTRRKLAPALFNSFCKERLPQDFRIVGYARRPWSHEKLRQVLENGIKEFAPNAFNEEKWSQLRERIFYVQGNLNVADDFAKLDQFLNEKDPEGGNRLYYLATAPQFFVTAVEHLGAQQMVSEADGWRRIVIEKPFGHDLSSAQALNNAIHQVFDEHQIYRIDHYLGKETAQNILYFRFANTIFEPVWNRNYIDNVQISVTEAVDVGHRAGYYDKAGVVRDMFQNHLMQLLSLVAMEPPASFGADAVRNEKVKLFSAIRTIELPETVRAQYEDYLQADGVEPDSATPTYAAMTLFVDNWRWQGVPFYLRSGKALAAKSTEIIIEFKRPPHLMFSNLNEEDMIPNILSMCIQPDEGIHLKLEAKVPDSHETQAVDMEFHYRSSFEGNSLPDAYERLLLDAIRGDAALFARSDGIEAAWRLMDPVIAGWQTDPTAPPMVTYARDSWGPQHAERLLAKNGRRWRRGCVH